MTPIYLLIAFCVGCLFADWIARRDYESRLHDRFNEGVEFGKQIEQLRGRP